MSNNITLGHDGATKCEKHNELNWLTDNHSSKMIWFKIMINAENQTYASSI